MPQEEQMKSLQSLLGTKLTSLPPMQKPKESDRE